MRTVLLTYIDVTNSTVVNKAIYHLFLLVRISDLKKYLSSCHPSSTDGGKSVAYITIEDGKLDIDLSYRWCYDEDDNRSKTDNILVMSNDDFFALCDRLVPRNEM